MCDACGRHDTGSEERETIEDDGFCGYLLSPRDELHTRIKDDQDMV